MTMAEPLVIGGLVNVRDLGGIITREGRVLRRRQVIRSDNPRGLTDEGRRDLVRVVDPRLVIDLRMALEVEREPYDLDLPGVRNVHLPMQPQAGVNATQITAGLADNLVDDYLRQSIVNAGSIVAALALLAEPANRPAMLHCTAGKDRTGIVVALLLDILGVEPEVIVADYHVTAANMTVVLERIRAAQVFQDNGLAQAPDWIFAAEPETMRGFLSAFHAEHGSAQAWALERGLTMQQLDALRDQLLEG